MDEEQLKSLDERDLVAIVRATTPNGRYGQERRWASEELRRRHTANYRLELQNNRWEDL
jgi:hypothetical protein